MPVLKIKNNGVWEQVGGIPDHTHVVDDITDFPTSLPANGGNADTVDGKHASDFASAAEMTTVQNDINDINTVIDGIEIPTTLPNPNALTFTGAVNTSYNGSSEVNVEIPDISGKMDKNNPTGTGSFSLNRKAGTVIGNFSHTEGYNTTASGYGSHAEGTDATASGYGSHVEGKGTEASSACQHVQGRLNIEDSSGVYADIIGNGASTTKRSNAATVDWHGNAWYAGNVYVGSTSGTNKDAGSKKLATEEYVNNSVSAVKYTEITYSELKQLRDNSQLVPGKPYCITDYICTINQSTYPNARAVNNSFDIIVIATSVNTLSEDARAKKKTGDTYYLSNNHLEAWKLKYSLDNDVSRFDWVDEENGKGVIYYLKDEFFNECNYDFKNIQFKRFYSSTPVFDKSIISYYYSTSAVDDPDNFVWLYTFSAIADTRVARQDLNQVDVEDASVISFREVVIANFNNGYNNCSYNSILKNIRPTYGGNYSLDNNVFVSTYKISASVIICTNNKIQGSSNNTFGDKCSSNDLIDSCTGNIFDDCTNVTLGYFSIRNTFKGLFESTFGRKTNMNTIIGSSLSFICGNYCSSNSITISNLKQKIQVDNSVKKISIVNNSFPVGLTKIFKSYNDIIVAVWNDSLLGVKGKYWDKDTKAWVDIPDNEIPAKIGDLQFVSYSKQQELTNEQKLQARDNIGVPTALKNPNALTIKVGGTTITYDGSEAKTVEIADGSEVAY